MRRRTKLAVVAGGVTAAIAGGAVLRSRLGGRASEAVPPDEDAMFTMFAPGGKYAFMCNGPTGWVMAKAMPRMEAGLYETVAEMLDLQPDDELLDIGCGRGRSSPRRRSTCAGSSASISPRSCCGRPSAGSRTGLPPVRPSW